MNKRFSVLEPLNIGQLEQIMHDILYFFAPINAVSGPHSIDEFLDEQERSGFNNIKKYRHQIIALTKKLEYADFLCTAGKSSGFTMGGERCYYFIKELSEIEENNTMWFGECLGFEYIQYKAKEFVIPITGLDTGIGTGILINNHTILTCAHVVNDLILDNTIKICDSLYEISGIKTHHSIDVGIIILSRDVNFNFQMVFGDASILDEVLTMGYPPVPCTVDAYLVSQKGEINSFVQNYDKESYFLYSSITRPGNSGGPIFNKKGHIIGVSTEHLERDNFRDRNIVPFYEGIPSELIIKALRELEPNLDYKYENYK